MDPVALPLLLGLWLFDAAALAPLLLFGSTKRLLDAGPTDSRGANYLLGVTAYAVVHVLVAFAPGIVTGTVGGWWLVLATPGLLVAAWVTLGVIVPALGWWDPAEPDGWDGRLALGTVAVGYVGALAALGLFALVGLFAVFARYPG
ncbi:hypothetical protein B4589_011270 [Halolamina sp. CBA1230]|uniref:hypothetical protein n=1 Tax=Halolamina sp. CBA1230 TaxID=1853690 RepID=UPI0009A1E735|nr:hypothetical protein [Halolamina sp. CBA1230]QKY20924.1 hypothetical protein B4589_011270 [Halolamina sp. CBA1230]